MSRNIIIEHLIQKSIEEQDVELVERKGIGHPDSIADGISEAVSRALSKYYLDTFGTLLHHNTDQVEIVGGLSKPVFGAGVLLKPIHILLSGRATNVYKGELIPIDIIAIKAAKKYLKKTIRHINVETDVVIESRIGHGSSDLCDVFERTKSKIPSANDTSFGVSYAPLSETEKIVLETEQFLNSSELKKKMPEIGEDIKVMGTRTKDHIVLTICIGYVSSEVKSIKEYEASKKKVEELVLELAKKYTTRKVEVYVNTGDDICSESVFLTVTGTSAETGDDGSTGRGNRVNGLITPNRTMSMEATSGKNPFNHIGKLYNLLSKEIANKIVADIKGVKECYVRLISQIGKPIDQPLQASVQVITDGVAFETIENKIRDIVDQQLATILTITDRVIKGELRTF